jgi:hypothetical protein
MYTVPDPEVEVTFVPLLLYVNVVRPVTVTDVAAVLNDESVVQTNVTKSPEVKP